MEFKPTDQQRLAINEGGNILVCAAAGSGKTAVLVERVIKKLTDSKNPVSADRLLIVTFTNAAAAEMRARIEKRLYEESVKDPSNLALKEQRYLISSAKICTIDSFCIDLVRENFHKLGIAPDFKISTGDKLSALQNKTVSEVISRRLENPSSELYSLLELTGCEYDESKLSELIKKIFDYSMVMPFPESFLEGLLVTYEGDFISGNTGYDQGVDYARKGLSNITALIESGLEAADRLMADGVKYRDYFLEYKEAVANMQTIVDDNNWDLIKMTFDAFTMPAVPQNRKLTGNCDLVLIRELRLEVLDEIDDIKKVFSLNRDEIEKKNRMLYPAVRLLVDMVKEYKDELYGAQLAENSLTFYNTEQLARELLCSQNEDGSISINSQALEYIDQFDEVLVDEYQDVNDLQDMLFYVLSNKESRLFAVGDVKQSIYGFRCANPNNFLEKKNRYIPIAEADENDAKKIILANNFRSRKEVCDYINYFFENIMTKENGPIVYDNEERLVHTAEFSTATAPTNTLCLVDSLKSTDDERLIVEADAIAAQIRRIMASGECIHKKDGGLRCATYSDFAILLRSANSVAPVISAQLEKRGIPVDFSEGSFIELLEVDTFLSLLRVIDNPADNVALLTVLMSPIFGFSAEELAVLRAEHKAGDLISVLAANRGKGEKIDKFYSALEYYRSCSAVLPLASFVFKLIDLTGYGDLVSAMPDGIRRRANLLKLAEYAKNYEELGGTLSGFAEYMRKNIDDKHTSAKTASGADSVKIMSIHTSKGLQFPVCIIANIDAKINNKDSTGSVLFSEKTGLGFKYYDEQKKEKTDTLQRLLISKQVQLKNLEEELRLVYVALTRAEDMLVIIGAYNNLEEKLNELSYVLLGESCTIKNRGYRVSSIGNWFLMTSLLHPDADILRKYSGVPLSPLPTDSHLKIEIYKADNMPKSDSFGNETEVIVPNDEISAKIVENMNYNYPFDALRNVEAKCSASSLANKAEGDKYSFNSRPAFMEKDGLTGAEKGTAMHKIMQFISFDAVNVEDEIERLKEWEYISEAEADAVDLSAIKKFFASDIFKRIKTSSDCRREMRFLTEIPAGEVDSSLDGVLYDERVIVQGAVDLCFVEADGVVIVDFKTDRVDNADALKSAYSEQLNIYEKAAEKIFLKPVKQKIIYSFVLGEEIIV